jgi:hypothetical protein
MRLPSRRWRERGGEPPPYAETGDGPAGRATALPSAMPQQGAVRAKPLALTGGEGEGAALATTASIGALSEGEGRSSR